MKVPFPLSLHLRAGPGGDRDHGQLTRQQDLHAALRDVEDGAGTGEVGFGAGGEQLRRAAGVDAHVTGSRADADMDPLGGIGGVCDRHRQARSVGVIVPEVPVPSLNASDGVAAGCPPGRRCHRHQSRGRRRGTAGWR